MERSSKMGSSARGGAWLQILGAVTAALMKSPKFDSEKGPGVYREDHHALFKYGAFVVVGKSAKDRKNPKDLVKLIGAYTGEDYLPTLKSLGY